MKRYKNPDLYEKSYPRHIPINHIPWIAQVGDHILIDGEVKEITHLTRLPIPGAIPRLTYA
jgi:hypothetical protein